MIVARAPKSKARPECSLNGQLRRNAFGGVVGDAEHKRLAADS